MANCNACGSPLLAGGSYCIQCKRFQNWGRQAWSSFKIQDVVTLVSVGTLAWTSLQAYLIWPHSEIKTAILSCSASEVQAVVSNTGNRPAVMAGGTLSRKLAGFAGGKTVDLELAAPETIPKGEAKIVKFGIPALPTAATDNCTYEIKFDAVEFDGNRHESPQSCPCPGGAGG